MRKWLLRHSSIYRHFRPEPSPWFPCPRCGTPTLESCDVGHVIGRVNYPSQTLRIHCDGSECE